MTAHDDTIETTPDTDETRRDFLLVATATVAGAGLALAAWPFIDSMNPAADVRAVSTIEVDLTPVQIGQRITVVWQGRPVFIDHRQPQCGQRSEKASSSAAAHRRNRHAVRPEAFGPSAVVGWYRPRCGVYNATKSALEAMSATLRMELSPWGIGVTVVQPGVMASEIRRNSVSGWTRRRESMSPEQAALYGRLHETTLPLLEGMEAGAADHADVRAAVADALTANEPAATVLAGPDTEAFAELGALPQPERDATLLAMWG